MHQSLQTGRRPLAAALLATTILAGGCKREPQAVAVPAETYIKPDTPPTYVVPASQRTAASVRFEDITAAAGIRFQHVNGAFGQKWMPETIGSGGGFFDYDGDGRPDILLVNSMHWPGHEPKEGPAPTSRLYRNRGDGTFEDVTVQAGLSQLVCYGMGAGMADYDGDGDMDIYLTTLQKNRLLRNDGGRFFDVTDAAGVGYSAHRPAASQTVADADAGAAWEWSLGCTWVDVDRDGDLDLFVCNYVQWTPQTDIWTTRDGKTKAYATPEKYDGASNTLFRNNGDGTFTDVTQAAGVYNPDCKSMSVVADDFNDDGWPDLFVSNDTQPNLLYINNGDGTFRDDALACGVAYDESGLTRAGMGVSTGDLTNTGRRCIVVGNFSGEPLSLYTQEGPSTFVDKAGSARLSRPTNTSLTFGVVFADFNLDGYDDLLLANGHIEPEIEAVKQDWQFRQRPQLFINSGAGQFVDQTDAAGPALEQRLVGRGLCTADIDADGDLDVLLTTNAGAPLLLRNDLIRPGGAGSSSGAADVTPGVVRVRLADNGANRFGVGTRLRAQVGSLLVTRFVRTGESYLGQNELTATIGLGAADEIARLEVRWPDGTLQMLEHVKSGLLVIERPRG